MPIIRAKEKISRRLGTNLFLKGERSFTQKSSMVRRPYPPGMHGKTRRRAGSEFAQQLAEKQKLRYLYGITETALKRIVAEALESKNVDMALIEGLEMRIDNLVYRMGFTVSRSIARHLVSHGHVRLNGKRITIPSLLVKIGQVVFLSPNSLSQEFLGELQIRLNKFTPPSWVSLDASKLEGKVIRKPLLEEVLPRVKLSQVFEYYSR